MLKTWFVGLSAVVLAACGGERRLHRGAVRDTDSPDAIPGPHSDTIYTPDTNQIFSVSTGGVTWASADPYVPPESYLYSNSSVSAVAGSRVVFVFRYQPSGAAPLR